MTSQDLIIGPVYFLVILMLAWFLRPLFTDKYSKPYFIPALALKMIAAVCLGLLYQFYYVGEGGDTFGYYYGAKRIWGFFLDNPIDAFRVIFWDGEFGGGIYKLVSRIPHYNDPASFVIDRIAGFLGLLTFGNYSGIAILFAVISFTGSWALFSSLKKLYPDVYKWLAVAILFIPSVVFWGSGILKDTITFAALCWMIWAFMNVFILKSSKVVSAVTFLLGLVTLFSVKKYILLVFLPALILWFYVINMDKIRNSTIRIIIAPFIFGIIIFSAYQAILIVGEDDPRYAIENVTNTVYITAHDIRFWTGREAGSGYELGTIPETWQDMVASFPAAVNVTLFRPYFWEVRNPLMLMLSVESMVILFVTIYLFFSGLVRLIKNISNDPFLIFALVFSIGFAFAVGISTWNYGTLVRYKLPMMPIFASFLAISYVYQKERKRKPLI